MYLLLYVLSSIPSLFIIDNWIRLKGQELYATRSWFSYDFECSLLLSEIRGENFGIPKDSRLTFHPQHEIPQMRKWFHSCKTPSDEKLKFFAAELNKGHVRQERPNVTVAKLKIWWKNERQREKRMQQQTQSENEAHGGKCDEDESQPSTSSDEIASTSKSYVELTNVSNDLLTSELLCKNSFSSDGSNTGDLFHDADFHWIKHWYRCPEDCFANYSGFEQKHIQWIYWRNLFLMIIHHKYIKYSQHFGNLYNVTGHIELHGNDLHTTKVVYLGVKITCNDLNIDESRTNLYKRQMCLIMMRDVLSICQPTPNQTFVLLPMQ